MANYLATDTDLTAVANAIRTKGGTSASLAFPAGFVSAIGDISGGGGGYSIDDIATANISGDITITASTIAPAAFRDTSITSVSSSTVTRVNNDAFYNCTQLAAVHLSGLAGAMATIAANAFYNCQALLKIANGDLGQAYLIPQNGFYRCYALATFVSDCVLSFGYSAMPQCTALSAVDFGLADTSTSSGSTRKIQGLAFNGCSALDTVIIRAPYAIILLDNVNAFQGTPFASGGTGGTLYVPSALISTYEAASNWSTILGYANNSIQAIEGSIYETQYADGTPIGS